MKKYLFLYLLTCSSLFASAQTVIRGRVTGAGPGKPLDGATITTDAPGQNTITDSAGYFSLKISQARLTLKVSFTGYRPATVSLAAPYPSLVTVTLTPFSQTLQEVTVSTGYQSLPLDRATGSFVQVDNQLFNRRVSTDVLSRLEGLVPGLLFNRNTLSAAGGQADISIRGTSTLFAASQPLIVVDGFPYDGDLNNLAPDMVESITVLKDAAAASIWGVKSGNGVIVITMKHGARDKKVSIDFNGNVTIGAKPDLKYNPNFLDANDFINAEQALFSKGYYDSNLATPYAIVSPVVAILAGARNGTISQADASARIDALRNIDVRNDLATYFYRQSAEQQYALNLSGGGRDNDYIVGGSYANSLSNLAGDKNSRVTLSSSYHFYPTKRLTITAGINFSRATATANSPLGNINGGPGYAIYPYAQLAANGQALPIVKDYASAYTDTAGGGKFYDWKYRPLDELRNADNTSMRTDSRINLGASYTLLPGLTAEARYAYESQKGSAANYYSEQTYYTRNLLNMYTLADPSGTLTYQIPQGGILQSSDEGLTVQRGRLQLNYARSWNQHELSVIAGSEINQSVTAGGSQTVYGYNPNTLTTQSVDFTTYFPRNPDGSTAQVPNTLGLDKYTDRYISYYSNAGYTYAGKYSFSLSGRIDQSNLFGVNTNQKSVPLFSTGFAWELSRENFYHAGWLPYLKLRLTYGYNGNVDKQVSALTTFQQINGAPYTGAPFSVIVSPGNPELRWERDRIINSGLDFGLKNNAVSGSIEYYVKNGVDLFGDTPLAPSTGFSTFRGNTADIRGHGLDIMVNANILRAGNFKWQSSWLLSYVLDKVTKYDAQLNVLGYLEVGNGNAGTIYPLTNRPLYAIYSYPWAGLTHDTGDPQGVVNGRPSTDYAAIISGTTTASMQYNGPSRPTTFGSFRNTFAYKRLSLSANIIYKLNYYFRRPSINYTALYTSWSGNRDFLKRWQKPGDEATTNVPSMPYPPLNQNRETFYEFSSVLVDKGDHVRLQDITLSYDLAGGNAEKRHLFSRLQVYAYANNVGILWRANHDGLDPDLFAGSLPLPRTLSLGLKATL